MNLSEQTRNQAFYAHRDSGDLTRQQRAVMLFIHGHPGRDWSSKELSKDMDIERSSATARINELEAIGYLQWGIQRRCTITGKTITPIRLPAKQGSLFN